MTTWYECEKCGAMTHENYDGWCDQCAEAYFVAYQESRIG